MHHITKIKIRNFRGIAHLETTVGPNGVIAQGACATGKTSFLRAIRAALAAQDIKDDAIRIGEDKCEIFVDLDDINVRRAITANGKSSLEVKTAAGDKKGSPAKYLGELLGTSPLDPLEIFLAAPKARREMVLAALPIRLTPAHLAKWIPELALIGGTVPVGVVNINAHGLEACERLHKYVYDLRADANRTVKEESAALRVAENEIDALGSTLPKLAKGTTIESAQKQSDEARVALVNLQAQKKRAGEHGAKTQSARERIAGWRKQAADTRTALPRKYTEADIDPRVLRSGEIAKRLKELEDEFEKLRAEGDAIDEEIRKMQADNEARKRHEEQATSLEKMADELAQSLSDAGEGAPTDFDLDEAQDALTAANTLLDAARKHSALAARRAALEDDRKALASAEARAEALTKIVDRLRVEAPAQLIAESQGIPGLGIDGETITLDGKSIDAISGAEQMRFAVEIARRANAKSKLLIVDGLERLDKKRLNVFIREATRDGYQLIASRVVDADGEMTLEHIEIDHAEAAE